MILPVKEVNNIFIITFFCGYLTDHMIHIKWKKIYIVHCIYDTYQMNKYIYYTALTLIQKYLWIYIYTIFLLTFRQCNIKSYKLPSDRLSLFRRSVNRWRVSAPARTPQLFTYRLNNHSRSRELITFLYDVADL